MNVDSDSLMAILQILLKFGSSIKICRSALLPIVAYSQHVCDDTNTPHVCRKWHKVIVDNFWCQELWGSKVDLQLFSGSVPGGRDKHIFVFGSCIIPIWETKPKLTNSQPKLIQQNLANENTRSAKNLEVLFDLN